MQKFWTIPRIILDDQYIDAIGIRKVLGASGQSIIILLARQLCKWVLIAIAISLPVSAYQVNLWLRNFAYHAQVEISVYAAAALFALLISLITISFQTIKTARETPLMPLNMNDR